MYLDGRGISSRGPRGEEVVDDSFLLVLHAGAHDLDLVLPGAPWAASYELVISTAATSDEGTRHAPGSSVDVVARSVLLLRALR